MNGMTDRIEWLRDAIRDRKAKAEKVLAEGSKTSVGPLDSKGVPSHITVETIEGWTAKVASEAIGRYEAVVIGPSSVLVRANAPGGQVRADDIADHVAANDPRDTIARCDSELAILDMAEREIAAAPEGSWDWDSADEVSRASTLEDVVRLLAQGYRHRPGYRAEDWETNHAN